MLNTWDIRPRCLKLAVVELELHPGSAELLLLLAAASEDEAGPLMMLSAGPEASGRSVSRRKPVSSCSGAYACTYIHAFVPLRKLQGDYMRVMLRV